jgi:hypothetical protein
MQAESLAELVKLAAWLEAATSYEEIPVFC